MYYFCARRNGRVVECGGLENRCPLARTGGSNPSSSATSKAQFCNSKIGLFSFLLPLKIHFQMAEGMKKGRKPGAIAEGLGF